MTEWEYRKIPLNETSRRGDDIDLLCSAGEAGWELVAILPNNAAYLKRPCPNGAPDETDADVDQSQSQRVLTDVPPDQPSREVKAKYRDPVTNDTWSGRGRMATWLKRKQDAGEDIDEYLV
jgi:H-NS histone family